MKSAIGQRKRGEKLKVYSLPIRNWNLVITLIIFFPVTVYSLPIRNWNMFTKIGLGQVFMSL